jgi:hypothetical protein
MPTITNSVRWATNTEELRANLKQGLDQIEATRAGAEKMVQALGGDKLMAAAHRYAVAVQEIGGVTKLTTAEQERVNAVVQKAIEKYAALGQTAPTALRELAAATKQADQAGGLLASTFGQVLAGFSAASLLNRAVSTLTDLGSEALRTAGTLVDLSNKTGLSTDTIQRMQFVAKQSGTDMTVFADAAFKMGVNIAEGTQKARHGAESLGLSWKDLRAASPDAQFAMVVEALERMEDPQRRNEAAVALFGKTAKEILPAIVDGYTRIAKEATVAGDAQIRALDAAGDAWDRWKDRTNKSFVGYLGNHALAAEALGGLSKEEGEFILQTDRSIKTTDDFTAAMIRFYLAKQKAKDIPLPTEKPPVSASFAADLRAAELGWAALTASEREEVFTALQLGKSHDDIINKLNITEEVLAVGKKAYEAHQEAVRKAGSEAEKFSNSLANLNTIGASTDATIASLDGTVVEGLKYYLAQGASVEDLARVYGLLVPQVEAVKRAMTDEKELLKELATLRNFTAKTAVESNAASLKTQVAMMQAFNAQIIANLGIETKARLEAKDLRLKATLDEFTYQQVKLGEWVADEKAKVNLNADNWQAAYAEIDAVAQQRFADLVNIHNQALDEMRQEEMSWGKGFATLVSGVPGLLAQAFTGGGGLAGFGKALGSGVGAFGGSLLTKPLTSLFNAAAPAISNTLGMTLTTAIGGAIPFIGPAIGAFAPMILGGFKKLFGGVSEEEKKGRATIQDFEHQMASTLTATQKLEAGNDDWKKTTIAVRDAYLATGRSEAEAEAAVKRLWDSSKKGAAETQAAIDAVNSVLQEQKQDQQDLQAAIQRYGFSIEQLGPAMQKQKLDDQAKQLLNDWRLLVGSGIAISDVNAKMTSSVQDYLTLARKTGQEVPAAMRPILQSMIDQGTLLDENGNAFTDIGQLGISFSETMTAGFDRVVKKLGDLLRGLGLLPTALDTVTDHLPGSEPPGDGRGGSDNRPGRDDYAATGGLVTALGIHRFALGGRVPWTFAPIGTDTVGAMLTPGELILTEPQQSKIADLLAAGAAAAQGLLAGGKPGPAVVLQEKFEFSFNLQTIDGSDLQQTVETKLMPQIVSVIEDRRRGYTARLQQALGTT